MSDLSNDPDHRDAARNLVPARIDASRLHTLLEELSHELHTYVEVAVGIRAEFDSSTAQDDPRIEAVEDRIGAINARISRAFEDDLGIASAHTTETWQPQDPEEELEVDTVRGAVLELGFVLDPGGGPNALHHAMQVIERGGERIVDELAQAGLEVVEWGSTRPITDDDEDGEDG